MVTTCEACSTAQKERATGEKGPATELQTRDLHSIAEFSHQYIRAIGDEGS